MVKDIERIFKPVKFEFGKIHIAGGFTTTPSAVTSRTVEVSEGRQHIFVKMAAKEQWLMTAVCGGGRNDVRYKAFRRTTLLDVLRTHIVRKADGDDDLDNVQPTATAADDYDPMDAIDSASPINMLSQGATKTFLAADKKGRTRYYRNRAKNCIVTVNVTSRCPEIDPTCTQMRPIKLFIVDRKTVWLSIDDVAWAIRYLYDQQHLKGIPVVADDDAGPGAVVAGSVSEGQ